MATSIPPHNAAELCDAALYLIAHPKATTDQILTFVPGPDFPTGGIIVDPPESIAETYRTGRGSFRVRATWKKEESSRGMWVCVVTEIPYGVQKSRLIEKIAELLNDKTEAYVLAVHASERAGKAQGCGLAWLSVTEGELRLAECASDQLPAWLARIAPSEVIYSSDLPAHLWHLLAYVHVKSERPAWAFDSALGQRKLLEQLHYPSR